MLAICNTNGSTIPRESDAVIYTHAGPEIAVASTKAFLAQITACYLLGLYLAQVRGNKFADEVRRDPRRARADAGADPAGARLDGAGARAGPRAGATRRSVLFLGRHVGFPVALEGALKLKELAYIHAEGFAAGELKHGPIALIEEGLPVFVIVPSPRGAGLAARQGRVQHPGDPRPRRPHHRHRGGGRRRRRAVRRRRHPGAAPRRCWRRWSRRCRCRCSPASWPRPRATTSTSRATWPSRSRSSERRPPAGRRRAGS